VREENRDMVVPAAVTPFSAMVALIAGWWDGPQPPHPGLLYAR